MTKYTRLKRIEERARKRLREAARVDALEAAVQERVVPAMAERLGISVEDYRTRRKKELKKNESVLDRLRALLL